MATTVSVGSAPVVVFTPQANAMTATITNTGTSTLYLGQAGVTAATGYPLPAGQSINATYNIPVYAVSGPHTTQSPSDTASAAISQGATSITVSAGGASFTNGMAIVIVDGNLTEIVTATATGSATSIPVTATSNAHASGVTIAQLLHAVGGSVSVHTAGS